MKTVFVPCFSKIKLKKDMLEKLGKEVKNFNSIGLLTVTQFSPQLNHLSDYLKQRGKKTFVAYGRFSQFKGQILGCDIMAAKRISPDVDCFVYLGTGRFHPIIVAAQIGKKVFCANVLMAPFGGLLIGTFNHTFNIIRRFSFTCNFLF